MMDVPLLRQVKLSLAIEKKNGMSIYGLEEIFIARGKRK